MKTPWIRKVLGGISFTSALFVFQACYGSPQDMTPDVLLEGRVRSKQSEMPILGIKVSVLENNQHGYTDETGAFSMYTTIQPDLTIRFEDVDSVSNGSFHPLDTIVSKQEFEITLDVFMDER